VQPAPTDPWRGVSGMRAVDSPHARLCPDMLTFLSTQGFTAVDMVRVRGIKPSAGLAGKGPDKTVTVTFVVRSDELGRFDIDVHVPDRGSKEAKRRERRWCVSRGSFPRR
jgi:hypothetical protein